VNSTLERIKKIQQMLDEKEYLQGGTRLPYWRRVAYFWIHVIKSFQRNRGPVRAAALAYTSILSLIPVLAVVVSISTGFLQRDKGGTTVNDLLEKFVAYVAPQLDLIQEDPATGAMNRKAVVQKIQSYIETMNSGTLGLTAGIALVFIAVMMLSNVEATFNDIWGATRGRTWSARVVQYWAAISLGPIFIVTAVALTSVGTAKNTGIPPASTNEIKLLTNIAVTNITAETSERISRAIAVSPTGGITTNVVVRPAKLTFMEKVNLYFGDSKIGPFLSFIVLSVFLTLFYRLMPATKVKWDAALVGGFVGGGLLQLNNLFNVIYLSKVISYSKIYGSLGAVPIFLLGLYFSWMIILLGAQVGYAYQNKQAFEQERQADAINQRGREFVALRLMTYIGQKFYLGEKPPTRLEIANAIGVPSQVASQILNCLVGSKLLVEVMGEETKYAPGRPIDKITVEDVLCALRVGQGTELATKEDAARAVLREQFDRVVLAEMHAAGAVTLQNLVMRLASLPSAAESPTVKEPAVAIA
jgi:membrane protein